MTSQTTAASPWWGTYEIPGGQVGQWRVGALSFAARWVAPEWRLAHEHDDDPGGGDVEVTCPVDAGEIDQEGELLRVVAGEAPGNLVVTPALADRPVVVRPEMAFRLLPGARVRLYVSTPAWIRLEVGDPPHPILDAASSRLNDTWFGPVDGAGELCYAIQTKARLHLENLPVKAHRVVTEVILEDLTAESFTLERLNLPLPNLSLYGDADGRLWTQSVIVQLKGAAEVDLGKGPPSAAREPELLAGPRVIAHRNILSRAVGALLV